MGKKEIILSIIIPCKNEEKYIKKCLDSILEQIKDMPQTEVLVIDSVSSDKSMEIAKQYPIGIIQLRENWFSSPASARYLGCLNTSGEYIFVIDADMELVSGFIKKAIAFMQKNPTVAGVAGIGTEYYGDGSMLENMYQRANRIKKVDFLGGAALFRRNMLERSGFFNPFLKAEEEQELCFRLSKLGFTLFSLPYPMIKHYTSLKKDNFKRRLKAGMYRGIGQMFSLIPIQKHFSAAVFKRFKSFYLFLALIIVFCLAITCLIISGNKMGLIFLAWIMVLIWLISCYIKREIREGSYSVFRWFLMSLHILQGMFDFTPKSCKYPNDVIIIKRIEYKS